MLTVQTLSLRVYEHLLRRIFSGELTPGSPLGESELAAQLGVSRTPVREALCRLAEYGVVETRRNHNAVVRRLGRDELIHLHQVREALEGMAAELACGRLTEADFARLDGLAGASGDSDAADYLAALDSFDVGLHRLISARSGNPFLAREAGKLHDLTMLIHIELESALIPGRRIDPAEPAEIRRVCWHQHVAIIGAQRSGDPASCRRTMIEHIRSICRYKADLMPPRSPQETGIGPAHRP
ncbi:GntR family transcriptional regulator [Isosphaeraceae bacterium EP7]